MRKILFPFLSVHTDEHSLSLLLCYGGYFLCREQRVTGIMVFVLTGLSVKLAPILKAGCIGGVLSDNF
jgi:hypothetical protein